MCKTVFPEDEKAKRIIKGAQTSPMKKSISEVGTMKEMILDPSSKTKTSTEITKEPFKREIVWTNAAVFVIGHVSAVYALYSLLIHRAYSMLFFGTIISVLNHSLGIQIGAHRYYSHRCFKASRGMQMAMMIAQTITSQNSMWIWVRDHRQHHKYSDTDSDPHNARNGFFFSHVGWLLSKKHPDVIAKGKGIDMSDMNADPIVMFQKRHYTKLWVVFALLLPWVFGALVWGSWWYSFLAWVIFRIVWSLNMTWLVNSWAHLYGTKPYDKNIMPSESALVSFLVMGEGWHNYHHTFPWDYKASEYGALFNVGARLIRMFARLGLVWDLKEASDDMVTARARKTGDGTPLRS